MWFTAHRSGPNADDEDYDSLWEDSEDEDSVCVLDTRDEKDTPSEGSQNDAGENDYDGSVTNNAFKEWSFMRESLLELGGSHFTTNTIDNISNGRGRSAQSRNALLDKLNKMSKQVVDQKFEHILKYEQTRREIGEKSLVSEDAQLTELEDQMQNLYQRRRDRINALIEEERRRQEEERRRQEEERRRQEEERRRLEEGRKRLEEEKRRLAEEERKIEEQKMREEEKRLRLEQEEMDRQAEADRIKKELEKAEREEQKRREEEERQLALKCSKFTDWSAVDQEFIYYKSMIEQIKKNIVEAVAASPGWRKTCFEYKRKLRPKLGQLTNSKRQLHKIQHEIDELLTSIKNVASTDSPLYMWLLNFLAKAIVSQAETEAPVSPHSIVPLALLAVLCMISHPQLKELLVARFVKKCPYVIGYTCAIDTEEGRKRMGYKRTDEKWEDESSYGERMSGIISVWAVITRSTVGGLEHPYTFSHSWTFLARILNKTDPELLTNAHYSAVAAWWEAAAAQFLDVYLAQGSKLLHVAWDDWTRASADKRFPAAARLRLLGEEWVRTGKLQTLKKMQD